MLTTTSGTITDASGATWSLVGSPLVVDRNAVSTGSGPGVQALLYFNSNIYYEGAVAADWFQWNGTAWVATFDPRSAQPTASASGTTLTTTSGTIVDASGVTWSLVTATGLEAARNGIADPTIPNVTLLLTLNRSIYAENSSSAWFRWNGTAWVAVTGDPRAQTIVLGQTATLTDSTGVVWALVNVNFGQVTRNNVTDLSSNNATQLVFVSGVMWRFVSSTGLWSSWNGSQTTITASPAGQSFVDTSGNVWTISAPNNNGEAFENGAPPNGQFSSNVTQLLLINGVVWQVNSSNQVYSWSGTAWVAAILPTGTTTVVWSTGTRTSPLGTVTRNPWEQPGGAGSCWNTPVGLGVTVGAPTDLDTIDIARGWNGTAYTAGPVGNINSTANFGCTSYVGALGQGQYNITTSANGRNSAIAIANGQLDTGATSSATVYIPTGAISAGPYPGDNDIVLYDPVTFPNRIFAGGCNIAPPGVQPGQGPFHFTQMEWDDATSDQYGHDADTGLDGYDLSAGLITGYDTDSTRNPAYPKIQHSLRYSTDAHLLKSNATVSGGQVLLPSSWPQRLQDPQSGVNLYSGNLVAGTSLIIPQSTGMPSGLTANQQGLFWTLQNHPLFWRDQASGGFNLTCDQIADVTPWMVDARAILPTFVALLRPIRNQHQTGQSFVTNPINGPGARSYAGPPPMAAQWPVPPLIPGQTPTPTPTPTPTSSGPVTSPNLTKITPGSGTITDASGNVFSIAVTNQQAIENGANMANGTGTSAIEYFNSAVYFQDGTSLSWFTWDGTFFHSSAIVPPSSTPTPTPTPTVTATPTPVPTTTPTPTPTLPIIFNDTFSTLSLHENWQAGDNWMLIAPGTPLGRGGPTFGELGDMWWTNPFNPSTPISGLYTNDANGLHLGIQATPSADQTYITAQAGAAMPFVGALLNSSPTLYQQYGLFEVVVSVPRITGITFIMAMENIQLTGIWPPEIDIRISTDINGVQSLVMMYAIDGTGTNWGTYTTNSAVGFDASVLHRYGVNWQSDFITFLVDGVQKFQVVTPAAYKTNPMFVFLASASNYPISGDQSGAGGKGLGDPPTGSLPTNITVQRFTVFGTATPIPTPTPTPTATPIVLTEKVWNNPGQRGRFWVLPQQKTAVVDTTSSAAIAMRNGVTGSLVPVGSVNQIPNFCKPQYIAQPTDPVVTVTLGTTTFQTRLPLGAQCEQPFGIGSDTSIAGTDASKPGLSWQLNGCHMVNASGTEIFAVEASGTTIVGAYGLQLDWGYGPIMEDFETGQPATGNCYGGINDYELTRARADPNYVVGHMVQCTLDDSAVNKSFVWPLPFADGSFNFTGPLAQGQTYLIPWQHARPTGMTRGQALLFDTFQQQGLFVYNFGSTFQGGMNINVYSTVPANSSLVSDIVSNISWAIQFLGILQNQTGPSTAKGMIGGVRNDAFPGPPPLDLSDVGGVEVSSTRVGAYFPTTKAGYSAASGGYTTPTLSTPTPAPTSTPTPIPTATPTPTPTPTGQTPIVAPLTGTVTTGTWLLNQQFVKAGSPSGVGYMNYNVLLPAQYSTSHSYPVLFVNHPDYGGMADGFSHQVYPRDGNTFVTGGQFLSGTQSFNSLFNNVAFRTAFPSIIVACECDQKLGDSSPNGNFGGYADSQNSGWNEQAVNSIFAVIVATYAANTAKAYTIGYSLGGIAALAWLVDNNIYNGPGLRLWAAGASFSDQLARSTPANSTLYSRMANVPFAAFSTPSDNVEASYDKPAWTSYTGNTNYPALSAYTSGGMAAIRAASTQYYYVTLDSTGGAPDQPLLINALGGIGTAFFTWLFSQTGGAPVPTPTPTPAVGAILITPGVGSITDSFGNVYTLTAGLVATEAVGGTNPQPMPNGSGTSAMEYYQGVVYGQDHTTGNWYSWNGTAFIGPVAAPPPPAATPTPTPTVAPSASDTTLTTTTGSIIDASSNTWTLVATPSTAIPPGGAGSLSAYRNGLTTLNQEADGTIDGTSNIVLMLFYNSLMYYKDDIWWLFNGTYWVIIPGDPRGAASTPTPTPTATPVPTESPNNTAILAGSIAAITDALGNKWTITSGKQLGFNGAAVASTANVAEIAYVNHVVWQENTSLNWFSMGISLGAVVVVSGPTTASPLPAAPTTIPIPPQATAAGMTKVLLFDDFNVAGTVAPNDTVTSGYNFYPQNGIGATTGVVTTDGSITINGSVVTNAGIKANGNGTPVANVTVYTNATAAGITNGNSVTPAFVSPNGGIMTLNMPTVASGGIASVTSTATSTQQSSVPATGVFKWFYAEVCMQFQPLFVCPGQWTALWYTPQIDVIPPGQTLLGSQELDQLECNAGNNGFTGNLSLRMTTSGHCFLSNDTQPFAGGDTYNGVGPTPGPAANTDNNFHLFGYLHQSTGNGTGLIHVYYDNVLQTVFNLGGADIITGSSEATTGAHAGWNWAELFQYHMIISACFFSGASPNQASTFATSGNSNTLLTPNLNVDWVRVLGPP